MKSRSGCGRSQAVDNAIRIVNEGGLYEKSAGRAIS